MNFLSKNKNISGNDRVVYGVILDVDIGYGLKYKDEHNLYLKLDIQQFDNFECTQLFRIDRLDEILNEFCKNYTNTSTVRELVHQRVCLNASDNYDGVPNAIAKNNPKHNKNSHWVYNNNWE